MSKKITKEIVEKIGNLARVGMSDEESQKIADSFDPIMEMIDEVNSVELDGDVKRNFRNVNTMREDELREDTSQNRDAILAEFPKKQDDYLRTKKIL